MTDERWQDLISKLTDDGKVLSRETEQFTDRPGSVERVIAESPMGKIRLSRTSEAKRLAEKAFFSKRGGSTVSIQANYDENDIIHSFTVERMNPVNANWEVLRLDASAL